MNTSSVGNKAEGVAANHLKDIGYEILSRNWKRTVCEIDIIAKKDDIVFFIEVKYRSRPDQGSGLDYITPKKLKQLKFAAEIWAKENDWEDDYRLMAVAVGNEGGVLIIEELLEIV